MADVDDVRGGAVERRGSRRAHRRVAGQEDGNFKEVDGKFFFKSPPKDRPYIGSTASVNRKSMLPVSGTKKRRRGVLASGKQTNYGNARNGWQLEELNRVRALTKIRDQLGDEFVDEISPELIKLAKERVQKRKEKEVEKAFTPDYNNRDPRIIGYDYTPQQYGSMKSYYQDDPLHRLHKNSLKRNIQITISNHTRLYKIR